MKGLDALECSLKLYKMVESAGNDNGFNLNVAWEYHETIKQDLDRLKELEKAQDLEINNLKFTNNENKYQTSIRVLKEVFITLGKSDIANTCWFKYLEELEKENQKLKKALDKACEMLEWGCPVGQNLIDDLDCENCKSTEKECWKKYFLNEVEENE